MNFNQHLVELMRLIDGDEASPTDLPIATLQQIIELGERRVYKDVRSRYNEKSFTDAILDGVVTPTEVTDNLAPLPDDFEATAVIHFGALPLLPADENFVLDYNTTSPTGDAIYFAEAGNSFIFAPTVADGTLVQGRYYCRLPALSEATTGDNALFQNEHDVFVYAALTEGAPLFNKFNQIQVWEAKYQNAVRKANKRREFAAYSAGRIQMRPSTRLMR